jgi:drug/metabolite transporter (DMT)-like permease
MLNSWVFCVAVFVVMQIGFLQLFKLSTRRSADNGALTVLVQVASAIFALYLSPFFGVSWPTEWVTWLLLGLAFVFYALSDRLNAAARKNMEISVESMLHQVWKLLFFFTGLLFLGYSFTWLKLLGGAMIVAANIFLFFEKGKFRFNKFAVLKLIAVVCFTAAMTLDVANSEFFNLPFYVFLTFMAPAAVLMLSGQASPRRLLRELSTINGTAVIFCALCNALGAVAILRAYQLEYFMSASISSVWVILNVAFAFVFLRERGGIFKKLLAASVVVGGLVLTVWG